jgi:hypothetical protein
MNKQFIEQMKLADQFELVSDHPWRAPHYMLIGSDIREHIDNAGLVIVEMLEGKYQVCRIEPFFTPAHKGAFDGEPVEASTDYQSKYYGEFTHNQLAQAFKRAATIAATTITENVIEV